MNHTSENDLLALGIRLTGERRREERSGIQTPWDTPGQRTPREPPPAGHARCAAVWQGVASQITPIPDER